MAKIHILLKTQACFAKHGCVVHNILDGVLLVSHFQHWQNKTKQKKKKKKQFAPFTSFSLFDSIFMLFSYIKIQMGSFAFMFSVLLDFLKIKLLVKTVHRQ